MSYDNSQKPPPRRGFLRNIALIPAAAVAGGGAVKALTAPSQPSSEPSQDKTPYTPTYFNQGEWAFIHAACDRLIPKDEHGPSAVEAGVPEFLDRHMQTPYAAGDIWYTAGPYLQASVSFGYQGRLVLREILRIGIQEMDKHSAAKFNGKKFAYLDMQQQDTLLKGAEAGSLKFDAVPDKVFFGSLLNEVRNGYFADPKYGGNKDMGAWKMIGYPGMRADYLDWVEVRDKAYPIGPVDLAGRRA